MSENENKPLYIIQFDNGAYWCGYNTIDTQIRKAVIYSSLKQANQIAKSILKAPQRLKKYSNKYLPIKSYQIFEVDIKKVKVIEEYM